jgi:phosphohistidine phosphatase
VIDATTSVSAARWSSTVQEAIDIALARSGAEPGPGRFRRRSWCAAGDHSSPPSVRAVMGKKSEVTDMDLYLMQHGQATTETENPERPLTDAGRAAVQRVAESARAADVRISGCLHSGKLRAEQTAQLLAREIGVTPSVEARAGLAPNDPVLPVAQWLRTQTEHPSLALVGHVPFLGRLASLLVAGDEQAQVVGFQMGGLVKLEPKVDRDGFFVAWALPPDLA